MKVVIIGTGFSGIGMAIKLRQAGFTDITILEQAASVGGTWRDNTYPGCACDIVSHLYSFSFYQNPNWSQNYSGWDEIQKYLEDCVDHFGIRSSIRFNAPVAACEYLNDSADGDDGYLWSVTVKGDATPIRCHYLISASGVLTRPSVPKLPQLHGGGFGGPSFHTAQWDHTLELEGKHVAVVGTGASAIQVIPEVVKVAKHVTVFQRTPPWVIRKRNGAVPHWKRLMYKYFPPLLWMRRLSWYLDAELSTYLIAAKPNIFRMAEKSAKKHMEKAVNDADRRAQLTPTFHIGCKRILLSNTYYPAMARDNVTIVSDSIEGVSPQGIVTVGGQEHKVDVIIYATGFEIHDLQGTPAIVGRNGRDLRQEWAEEGQHAYYGTFVHGFPNYAVLLGPNTGLGTNSIVYMIECQINLVVRMIQHMQRKRLRQVEVKRNVEAEFNSRIQIATEASVWNSGCRSWYLDGRGRNTTLWPFTTLRFWWETTRIGSDAFVFSA
jgi:cation diffusion facilitator CzcD-associated flavoprotein CzcO